MLRIAIGIAFFAGVVIPAPACWMSLAPGVLEADSPIIVRGKIVAIQEAKKGQMRADDLAEIEIAEILKNELKDVPLKVGDKFTVRMISRGNMAKMSTDLNYPLKTDALWLIKLNAKGEFRIDGHPDRKRALDAKPELRGPKRLARAVEKKIGDEPDDGKVTKADWIKRVEIDEKREAEERAKREAEQREIREIAADLAKAERIDSESMRRYQKAVSDTRRDVFQINAGEQPLRDERLVAVAGFVLAHDPDASVRGFAVSSLCYATLKDGRSAVEVLITALKDPSESVRLSACAALVSRGEKGHTNFVRALLKHDKKDVRFMAVRMLGSLGDAESIPAILKLYEEENPGSENAWTFTECLARLGEKKISLSTAKQSMASDNWNIRYFVADALAEVVTVDAVPTAMECFALELRRILRGEKQTGFDERIYQKLIAVLVKRTGKDFGADPVAWAKWWDTARLPYAAPALEIDVESAMQAYTEHVKLKAAK